MSKEITSADKRLRLITLAVAAILVASGFLLLQVVLPRYLDFLRNLAVTDPARLTAEYERAFYWMFGLIALLTVAIGAHVVYLGVMTRRAAMFPPPQVKVIVDMPIVRGEKARRLGGAMIIGALLFMLIGLAAAWYMHRTTHEMLTPFSAPLRAPSLRG